MMLDLIWEGSLLQKRKGLPIIVTTLFGIVILVRELQRLKAPLPIVVTLFGIFMLMRELQRLYLLLVDYQYYTL